MRRSNRQSHGIGGQTRSSGGTEDAGLCRNCSCPRAISRDVESGFDAIPSVVRNAVVAQDILLHALRRCLGNFSSTRTYRGTAKYGSSRATCRRNAS